MVGVPTSNQPHDAAGCSAAAQRGLLRLTADSIAAMAGAAKKATGPKKSAAFDPEVHGEYLLELFEIGGEAGGADPNSQGNDYIDNVRAAGNEDCMAVNKTNFRKGYKETAKKFKENSLDNARRTGTVAMVHGMPPGHPLPGQNPTATTAGPTMVAAPSAPVMNLVDAGAYQ